jgi:hypothetical protein
VPEVRRERAGESLSTRLRHHIDLRSTVAAILGRVAVGDHPDFLNRVDARNAVVVARIAIRGPDAVNRNVAIETRRPLHGRETGADGASRNSPGKIGIDTGQRIQQANRVSTPRNKGLDG